MGHGASLVGDLGIAGNGVTRVGMGVGAKSVNLGVANAAAAIAAGDPTGATIGINGISGTGGASPAARGAVKIEVTGAEVTATPTVTTVVGTTEVEVEAATEVEVEVGTTEVEAEVGTTEVEAEAAEVGEVTAAVEAGGDGADHSKLPISRESVKTNTNTNFAYYFFNFLIF